MSSLVSNLKYVNSDIDIWLNAEKISVVIKTFGGLNVHALKARLKSSKTDLIATYFANLGFQEADLVKHGTLKKKANGMWVFFSPYDLQ